MQSLHDHTVGHVPLHHLYSDEHFVASDYSTLARVAAADFLSDASALRYCFEHRLGRGHEGSWVRALACVGGREPTVGRWP